MTDEKGQKQLRTWISSSRLKLVVGIAALVIGMVVIAAWLMNPMVPILGMVGLLMVAGGGIFTYRTFRRDNVSSAVIVGGGGTTDAAANCLNIYATAGPDGTVIPERISFESMPKPEGQPQQCLNNNRWFHVNIWDVATKRLIPFVLPDTQYSDPSVLAKYLEQPNQRLYMRHRANLTQYIGVGLLALMVGAGFIGLIAVGG